MALVPCPERLCTTGKLILAHQPEDHQAGSFTLTCDSCSQRASEIPGYPMQSYLRRLNETAQRRRFIEQTAGDGYLTGGYLQWAGTSRRQLARAWHGCEDYLNLERLDAAC